VFVGALAYADDIVLLAPTPRAMCHMLQICESYGQEFFIQFNANKSACMLVGKKFVSVRHKVQFYIDGQQIPVVDDFLHLSHTVVSQLDDNKEEIWNKRNELCGKINNVLCYFKCCDPVVKVRLLRSYCSDLYGSVLWDSLRLLTMLRTYAKHGEKASDVCGSYLFRHTLDSLNLYVNCYQLKMNFCVVVQLLLSSACLVRIALYGL